MTHATRSLLFATMAAGCGPAASVDTGHTHPTTVDTSVDPIAPIALCINEFMAQSEQSWEDGTGAFPDWIELHNPTASPISLETYALTDDADNPQKYDLDNSLVVDPGGFLVLAADGLPELGPTHLPFSLSAGGESLGLFRYDGAGEVIHFGAVQPDFAWSRTPDCCPDVATCTRQVRFGSPGLSNGASE